MNILAKQSDQILKEKPNLKVKKKEVPQSQLLQYGSFHLEIRSPDSDIDLVLLAPNFVEKEHDFFGVFYKMMKANKKVESLVKIT